MFRAHFGKALVIFLLITILSEQPLYPSPVPAATVTRVARELYSLPDRVRPLRPAMEATMLGIPNWTEQDTQSLSLSHHFEALLRRDGPATWPNQERSPKVQSASSGPREIVQTPRMRSLPAPLVPVGAKTYPEEDRALNAALEAYGKTSYPDQLDSIASFVHRYPNSPWNTALLLSMGAVYRKTGHFSEALGAWEEAWAESKALTDSTGKAMADAALGKLALFYAYLGRTQELSALMESVHGRSLTGAATENMVNAAEGLAMMQKMPDISFRCGPLALARIFMSQGKTDAAIAMQKATSTFKGTSLVQLLELTKKAGLDYQMAYRNTGSQVIVPAVVNWKVGHYAAVLASGSELRVGDSTFGEDIWMRQSTLDEESSGYFLIPAGPLPAGWRSVPPAEGASVWGRGNTGGNAGPGPGPCDPQAFSQCDGACDDGGAGGGSGGGGAGPDNTGGMTTYNVDAMPDSLELHDRVLSYSPPFGRPMNFDLFYMHRDDVQPPVFNYTNFGPKWTSNWISYVTDNTTSSGGTADLYFPGGGQESYTYNGDVLGTFQPGLKTQAQLLRHSISESIGANVVTVYQYQRFLPDGTVQVFQNQVGNQYFLTSVYWRGEFALPIFLQYQELRPAFGGFPVRIRLSSINDATGRSTTLSYGLPNSPLLVTAVTDPFGRKAVFNYSQDGHLESITDPIGITSSFTWSADDFISQLATPYGTTNFSYLDGYLAPPTFSRSLTITDSLGLTSRVDYVQNAPGVQYADPQNTVPQGMAVANILLWWRNAFVWGPSQLALATKPDGTLDYTKAHILHFLHLNDTTAAPILESEKYPLENRVWYTYDGQPPGMPWMIGSTNKPNAIGRVLDDGITQTTQLTTFQRNSFGRVTQLTDPVSRQFTLSYSANGIDLLSIAATTGSAHSVLLNATYNSQHMPLTVTDAAGETSTMTYNQQDKLLTFTNALDETTKYSYNSAGFLVSIQIPAFPTAANIYADLAAFTYDSYGRVQTITNELGYTETLNYDQANRPTTITFPDGTMDNLTYQFLDLASFTDRMNRTTNYQHDAGRRLVTIRDPLGLSTQFSYCACGSVSAIVDPAGNKTSFNFDLEGRVISRQLPDGSQTFYGYENTTSRLKSVTDGNGLGPAYGYNLDNTLSAVLSGNTPLITFSYDPIFLRISAMKDTLGVTNYAYYPASTGTPSPGAMHLKSETSPDGDAVSYTYDAVGRVLSTSVDGVTSAQVYDSIGRVALATNPLGTFAYLYVGASRNISEIATNSGPSQSITYYDAPGDFLPKQISWAGIPQSQLPTPPSPQCSGDKANVSQLERELREDRAWLAKWCASPLSNECQAYGAGYYESVQYLNEEIRAAELQVLQNCAPLAPGSQSVMLSSFTYAYDADDEITQITFGGNGINFPSGPAASSSSLGHYQLNYDADGELLGVAPVGNLSGANYAYSYSSTSNILSSRTGSATTSYSYNNLNQLTTPGTTYDGDGNLTMLGQTKFEWIPAVGSRPVSLSQPDWNLSFIHYNNGSMTQFNYDGLARRTQITENGGGSVTSAKRYVWCGYRICQEHDMMSASASLPGGPVTKNYFSQGVQINGSPYYYTLDGQGSVIQLVNSEGAVVAQYQYDPYGNQAKVLGWPSDIGYTGLFDHQPSGLALAVFREYSPTLGRWLNRDPIGEFATIKQHPRTPIVNLYACAMNNPLGFKDPSGLDPVGGWAQWASRIVFTGWTALTGGATGPSSPPADFPPGQGPFGPEQGPGPTDPTGGLGSGGGTGPGSGPPTGGGPGGGSVQNVGGWLTWVPGSLCTPLIFPGHCFFFPNDPSCGGGA